ncbi:OmpA family protein [Nocardiopsis exhalans]|uniref:OmpA family protein n=1 Tax=Nocardiopsis exhalans TaxID=163604 RepID=A0ABY5DEN1_9ACTN|nr:OmpA family protein [Nocardiopsis exhalans]USY21834.1 OmpA family protein [Nocardiopsis exhalans]
MTREKKERFDQTSQTDGKTLPPKRKSSQKESGKHLWSGIAASLILLASAGCVIGTEEPPEAPQAPEAGSTDSPNSPTPDLEDGEFETIVSSTSTATDIGSDLQIDINALERLENDLLRLRISITNNSSDSFNVGYGLANDFGWQTASNISLVDDVNQKRYLSQSLNDGSCFCDTLSGPIESGETETLWVIFPGDQGNLDRVTVTTPMTAPFFDIPINDVPESVENNNLDEAQILDLTLISDSIDEDQTGRTESGDEVSIILSSDVLFETNDSDLSDESQEILKQVAQEIDDASSSVVSIDGYADNTGDDSINAPLSEERANSVESALANLITRQGVTFEVEGHGSAAPIADNNTEEGRERNRRVSVTFEK